MRATVGAILQTVRVERANTNRVIARIFTKERVDLLVVRGLITRVDIARLRQVTGRDVVLIGDTVAVLDFDFRDAIVAAVDDHCLRWCRDGYRALGDCWYCGRDGGWSRR